MSCVCVRVCVHVCRMALVLLVLPLRLRMSRPVPGFVPVLCGRGVFLLDVA